MFIKCFRIRRGNLKLVIVFITLIAVIIYVRQLRKGNALLPMRLSGPGRGEEAARYEQFLREYEAKIIPNLGDDGMPALLEGAEREAGDAMLKKIALNSVLSDRIPLNRTLKDPRNPK